MERVQTNDGKIMVVKTNGTISLEAGRKLIEYVIKQSATTDSTKRY